VYLGVLLNALTETDPHYYVAYLGLAIQVGAGVLASPLWRFQGSASSFSAILACATLLWLGAYGLFRGNFLPYWGADVLALGVVASGLVVGASAKVTNAIVAFHRTALPWGTAGAVFLLTRLQPAVSEERLVAIGDVDLSMSFFAIRDLCLPGGLLLLVDDGATRRSRFFVALSLVAIFGFGLFTATRGDAVLPILLLCIGWLYGRVRGKQVIASLLVGVLVTGVVATSFGVDRIGLATSNLLERSDINDLDAFSNGRMIEGEAFLEKTSGLDFIIGRGLGGAYDSIHEVANLFGMQMVHFGHLHLVLKGGLVFLALVLVLFLFAAWRGITNRGSQAAGAAAFVVVFMVANIGHTTFLAAEYMTLCAFALAVALQPMKSVE
jgi:hypothetical protein